MDVQRLQELAGIDGEGIGAGILNEGEGQIKKFYLVMDGTGESVIADVVTVFQNLDSFANFCRGSKTGDAKKENWALYLDSNAATEDGKSRLKNQ